MPSIDASPTLFRTDFFTKKKQGMRIAIYPFVHNKEAAESCPIVQILSSNSDEFACLGFVVKAGLRVTFSDDL